MKGLVSGIERFAIHDGPGIRTLVMMKGCPLRCLWCSSPQTQSMVPQILHDPDACQRCAKCSEFCPDQALMFSEDDGMTVDPSRCNGCGQCVPVCPNHALEMVGRYWTPEGLFQEVTRDSIFFRRSQGGVTVGGGEPTLQHEFVAAFLKRCQSRHIHIAIETCGSCHPERLTLILEHADLVFMDIKHLDDRAHRELTGASNTAILKNIVLVARKRPLVLRIPVIPGCNDSETNIRATARFAAELGPNLQGLELLPYHRLGMATYRRLGKVYPLEGVVPPARHHMERLRAIIERYGVKAQIGG